MKRAAELLGAMLAGAVLATVALVPLLARAKGEADNPYFPFEQLGRVLAWIENEYVDPVERARLVEGATKGMVAELDPHSAYLPPEDYGIFQADTEGQFGGVGVEVDFGDQYITIIAPIEGSPAARAGILPGDRVLAIDNQPVQGKSALELVRAMRGEPGTRVQLTVRREGEERLRYFRLTRQIINVASIASQALSEGVAYLRIKTFQSGTHAELMGHVRKLRTDFGGRLGGIVLDMRNNPGGLVNEATAVADEFLSAGVIYTTRRRGKIVDDVRADPLGALRRGPVAVLVNEYSASAAELVAGALQDNRRAAVVGAPTFGKGSVQTIVDLPGGAGLRLTTLRYYTPSGRPIQARGVKPDVAVSAASAALGFGVLKEENLEGHLPAVEGARAPVELPALPPLAGELEVLGSEEPTGSTDGQPKGVEGADAPGPGALREVPTDPERGKDEALKIAYRIVTGRYAKAPRSVP